MKTRLAIRFFRLTNIDPAFKTSPQRLLAGVGLAALAASAFIIFGAYSKATAILLGALLALLLVLSTLRLQRALPEDYEPSPGPLRAWVKDPENEFVLFLIVAWSWFVAGQIGLATNSFFVFVGCWVAIVAFLVLVSKKRWDRKLKNKLHTVKLRIDKWAEEA